MCIYRVLVLAPLLLSAPAHARPQLTKEQVAQIEQGHVIEFSNKVKGSGVMKRSASAVITTCTPWPVFASWLATSTALCAAIDPALADNKWITPANHLFEDRRPEFYTPFSERNP